MDDENKIISRVVDNMDRIDIVVYTYIIATVKNSKSKDVIYEAFKDKIDEFVDIFGLNNIKDWEAKLYTEVVNRKRKRSNQLSTNI